MKQPSALKIVIMKQPSALKIVKGKYEPLTSIQVTGRYQTTQFCKHFHSLFGTSVKAN